MRVKLGKGIQRIYEQVIFRNEMKEQTAKPRVHSLSNVQMYMPS